MHHVSNSDEAHEPLIQDQDSNTSIYQLEEERAEDSTQDEQTTHSSAPLSTSTSSAKPHNKALWLLTLSASLSGLLFGYDTGIISSTLISLHDSLARPLTTWDKSLITSSTSFLALLSSPIAGYLADRLGRLPVIAFASVLFVLGAGTQAAAGSVWIMVFGRGVVGAAVGLASSVTPLYISEIAPAASRGGLVTVQSLFITGGQVVAYLVGWAVRGRWRWAVGLGALPAVVQFGLLVGGMEESPRWLVQQGRESEARRVLEWLGGERAETERLVLRIRDEVYEENAAMSGKAGLGRSLRELVGVPGNRRALTIACMLQGLQQLCGFNSLMYFSATIFTQVGFTSPITTSLSIAITNFLSTLLAFRTIDRIGRRRMLLYSIPIMAASLGACAGVFTQIDPSAPSPDTTTTTPTTASSVWPVLLLVSLLIYVSTYAIGLGCIPWQQSELFPLSVRSLGSGLATTTNWTANALTAMTFLPMMQVLGASVTFAVYAGVCAAGWGVVWGIYPETAGLGLEEVGGLLREGWGVRRVKGRKGQEVEGRG